MASGAVPPPLSVRRAEGDLPPAVLDRDYHARASVTPERFEAVLFQTSLKLKPYGGGRAGARGR